MINEFRVFCICIALDYNELNVNSEESGSNDSRRGRAASDLLAEPINGRHFPVFNKESLVALAFLTGTLFQPFEPDNPEVVTKFYLAAVKQVGGLPRKVRSDNGTENSMVAQFIRFCDQAIVMRMQVLGAF